MATAQLPAPAQCEVCGYASSSNIFVRCLALDAGCDRGRHEWCIDADARAGTAQSDQQQHFVCTACQGELTVCHLSSFKKLTMGQDGAEKPATLKGQTSLKKKKSEQPELKARHATDGLAPRDSRAPPNSDREGPVAGVKRPGGGLGPSNRPLSKSKVDSGGPSGSAAQDLLSATMAGLQKESQRHKASRETAVPLHAHAESESRSEQRLKQRALQSHAKVPTSRLWEQQQLMIELSTKEKPLWQGSLTIRDEEEADTMSMGVFAYGVAGNVHSMDAAMRLPKERLQGTLMSTKTALDMSSLEAAENAALIFKSSSDDDKPAFDNLINKYLFSEKQLVQILLGDDKPIWMALVPGPDNACFGVFVRFAERLIHSEKQPGRSLLRKEERSRQHKLLWPDQARSTLRSTACERGPGLGYTPSHVYHPPDEFAETAEPVSRRRPSAPEPGPLHDMSVAIVGFLRDHEAIKDLRQKLTKAGARTFSTNSPWPGCVNVMVFPEQMVEKDLGLENSAPKELQPVREFLLAKGTRFFIKIDYPLLCCQLRRRLSREEEAQYKIRELWPEGVQVTADASTLHAAAATPADGSASQLEQVFEELEAGAAAAQNTTCVWMLSVAEAHLKRLEAMKSPAFDLCKQHMQSKRCGKLDDGLASSDDILNTLRLAHFFRWYCRHVILLVRPDDKRTSANAETTKTIHFVEVGGAAEFLRSLRL